MKAFLALILSAAVAFAGNGTLMVDTSTGEIKAPVTATTFASENGFISSTGDGSGLTNLNASHIATGTLANARLSAQVILSSGSYTNPSWISSLAFGKLTSVPTTLSGYGITDAQPLDADLTAIAALSTTTYGRSLLTAANAAGGRTLLLSAASGANSDITSLTGLTTALSVAQGGTGSTTASAARTALSAAASGSNTDITSLSAPALGAATATTQSPGDNTTKVSTTAFVTAAVAANVPTFANPSATIGLSAVNGAATTSMRSDAAPAIGQAITPTWSALHTFSQAPASNTAVDSIVLTDTTAATSGNQQYSPGIHFTGQGWKTTSTAASQTADFREMLIPVQGTTSPTARLAFMSQVNGGGYTEQWGITSAGKLVPQGDGFSYIGFSSGTVSLVGGFSGGTCEVNASSNGITIASTSKPLLWNGPFNSSPSLYPSGTTLKVRLADNSGDAPLTAGAITLSGGTSVKSIRHGTTSALIAGTTTVSDTATTANTRYFFSVHTLGTITVPTDYYVSTRNAGTSFVISSAMVTDTSTLDYLAIEP